MCAYKLCKVEFRYWGMQTKIERFIHDVGEWFVMISSRKGVISIITSFPQTATAEF